jgi:hypothetical protein
VRDRLKAEFHLPGEMGTGSSLGLTATGALESTVIKDPSRARGPNPGVNAQPQSFQAFGEERKVDVTASMASSNFDDCNSRSMNSSRAGTLKQTQASSGYK